MLNFMASPMLNFMTRQWYSCSVALYLAVWTISRTKSELATRRLIAQSFFWAFFVGCLLKLFKIQPTGPSPLKKWVLLLGRACGRGHTLQLLSCCIFAGHKNQCQMLDMKMLPDMLHMQGKVSGHGLTLKLLAGFFKLLVSSVLNMELVQAAEGHSFFGHGLILKLLACCICAGHSFQLLQVTTSGCGFTLQLLLLLHLY